MMRFRDLVGPVLFTLAVCSPAFADPAAEEDADRAKREEEDRAFLKSSTDGSISNPLELATEASVAKLCAELELPRRAMERQVAEGAEPLLSKKEIRARRRAAMRNVYEVTVQPGWYQVGDYRFEAGALPLRVDRAIAALDGALTLHVMQRGGSSFKMPAKEAAALARRVEDKEIALRVVFVIDDADADQMSPCFTYPKSASWAVRVEPISYQLLDRTKIVVSTTTPAKKHLERFVEPGAAVVRASVSVEGALDPDVVSKAIDGKKQDLEACLRTVMSSAGDTGTLGFGATAAPSGVLEGVSLEVDALGTAPDAAPCVERVLASVAVPKGAKASRVHVTINVERDRDSSTEVLSSPK